MDISIEMDRENDLLYVLFRGVAAERGVVAKTIRLTDAVVADLDAEGRLIGLDIVRASKTLGLVDLERLSVAVAVDGGKKGRP